LRVGREDGFGRVAAVRVAGWAGIRIRESGLGGRGATEILLERETIAQRVREMGQEISRQYEGGPPPLLIGLLKGSILFIADLVREMSIDVDVDFISISSYQNRSTSSGSVRLLRDLDRDVFDRHILVVEDIIDSGLSLSYIRNTLLARNPRSLRIATLLDKRERRVTEVPVDFIGFRIPDRFVVGYGLDYRQRYRGLPHVALLSPSEVAEMEG
jgi:hypoxanthine phosphoribosyltransferase